MSGSRPTVAAIPHNDSSISRLVRSARLRQDARDWAGNVFESPAVWRLPRLVRSVCLPGCDVVSLLRALLGWNSMGKKMKEKVGL